MIVVVGSLPFLLNVDADPDLWWHVRTGEVILDSGAVPDTDTWSFTAAGADWTNHEWLTDVAFAAAFSRFGNAGLLVLRGALLVLLVGGLVVAYSHRVREPLLVLGLVLVTSPILGSFINVRAHSFSYALLVWTVVVLDRARAGRLRLLYALPVMMLVWVNLHGGFILGLGLVGLSLLLMLVGWEGGQRPSSRNSRLIIGAGLATLVVTVANPNGLSLFGYLASELGANHSIVSEWQPPSGAQLVYFWLYLLVPLALWIAARQWRHVSFPVLLLITAYSTYRHTRFFVLMGLFGSLVAVAAVGAIVDRMRSDGRLSESSIVFDPKAAAASLIALVVVLGVPFVTGAARGEGGVVVDTSLYPIEAVNWIAAEGIGPNVAGPLPYGGYIIYRLGPEVRVAVDGRNLTVYDDEWVDRYLRSLEDGTALEVLDESVVDAWLLPADSPQIAALAATSRWSVAYVDEVASVVIPAPAGDLVKGPGPPSDARFP